MNIPTGAAEPRATWSLRVFAAALAVCLLAIAPRSSTVGGFSHDSAYIDRLAQNLVDGRGLVNDALWPVFLMPAELPMPFHNQNPLYGVLIAVLSRATGLATTTAGFAISALAAAALAWGIAVFARERLGVRPRAAMGIGLAALLFPPVWASATRFLPDMLCAALLIWSMVWLARAGHWAPVLAGLFFGLSWLTRSTATLGVPAMVAYLLLAFGLKRGIVRGLVVAVSIVVVVSPWLAYTAHVWGHPLRSDTSFVVVSDYHTLNDYGGDSRRYWHAAKFPATLGEVLRTEPARWLSYWAHNVPIIVKLVAKGFSGAVQSRTSPVALVALLAILLDASIVALQRRAGARREHNALLVALAIFLCTHVLVFGMAGRQLEIRYACPIAAAIAAMMAACWLGAVDDARSASGLSRVRAIGVLVAGVVLVLYGIREDARILAGAHAIDLEKVAYYAVAQRVAAIDPKGAPVVVGDNPYFFNEATGRRALSIPLEDPDLERLMDRYRVRYVALTDKELEYWRPSWRGGSAPPPFLRVALQFDNATVFVRQDKEPGRVR